MGAYKPDEMILIDMIGDADLEAARGVAAQGEFGAIHLEDARVAAGGALARGNGRARKESELHQTAGIVAGHIDPVQHRRIASAEVDQAPEERFRFAAVDTELHIDSSMRKSEIFVKRPGMFLARFRGQRFQGASK